MNRIVFRVFMRKNCRRCLMNCRNPVKLNSGGSYCHCPRIYKHKTKKEQRPFKKTKKRLFKILSA
jgi:hypothetical protein